MRQNGRVRVVEAHTSALSPAIGKGCFIISVTNHNETASYN